MEKNRPDIELISGFHAEKIRQWGVADVRTLGYSDRSSQLARFEVISALHTCPESVLDIGCGTGDLFAHIHRNCREFEYRGIDQQPEFIRYANNSYGHIAGCRFSAGDFARDGLPPADVVVACGALSYRSADESSYLEQIERLFGAARVMLVFTMLDKARMFPGEVIVGHDPARTMQWCRSLTDDVAVIRGHLSYDFAVVMARGPLLDARLARLPCGLSVERVHGATDTPL